MSSSVNRSTAMPSEDMLAKRDESGLDEIKEGAEPAKKYKFADEIVIDGKKVLDISADKMFYSEPTYKRERMSRWSNPVSKKSKLCLT